MKETASLNNIFYSKASPMCSLCILENKNKEARKIGEQLNGYDLNIVIFLCFTTDNFFFISCNFIVVLFFFLRFLGVDSRRGKNVFDDSS